MSHRARRSRAESPDEAVELAADEVRRAFAEWAARFVELLVRDFVRRSLRADDNADAPYEASAPTLSRGSPGPGPRAVWHVERFDATIRGLFNEAGRARTRKEVFEQAFRMLDKQSADELRTTGVSVSQVVPQAEARRAEWLRGNTDLIKAEEDLRRRVERILQDPLNQGRSVSDIAKMLEEQAGYSTSRAVLTARDQTLKLYGQIQQERQQNAGITRYVWTTSLDERVRPDHAELDGTVQSWSDPPVVDKRTGRRGHPGFDYQCRCTAVPVLDEPAEGEAPAPQVRQADLRQRAIAEGRFAAPPPREPVMVPSQAEIAAERVRRESESHRLRLEREADARIAAARLQRPEVAPVVRGGQPEQQARVAAVLDRVGYRQFYSERPEPAIELRAIPGNALGVFNGNLNRLHVTSDPALLRKWARGKALPAPSRRTPLEQLTDIAKTPAEVQQITAAHEFGHAVHMTGQRWAGEKVFTDEQARRVDALVEGAFAKRERAVTRYGDDAREWFAEAFAAYHHSAPTRSWLRGWSRIAFDAVEAVMKERGIDIPE